MSFTSMCHPSPSITGISESKQTIRPLSSSSHAHTDYSFHHTIFTIHKPHLSILEVAGSFAVLPHTCHLVVHTDLDPDLRSPVVRHIPGAVHHLEVHRQVEEDNAVGLGTAGLDIHLRLPGCVDDDRSSRAAAHRILADPLVRPVRGSGHSHPACRAHRRVDSGPSVDQDIAARPETMDEMAGAVEVAGCAGVEFGSADQRLHKSEADTDHWKRCIRYRSFHLAVDRTLEEQFQYIHFVCFLLKCIHNFVDCATACTVSGYP